VRRVCTLGSIAERVGERLIVPNFLIPDELGADRRSGAYRMTDETSRLHQLPPRLKFEPVGPAAAEKFENRPLGPTNLQIPNSAGLDTTLQLLVPEAISRCNDSMRRERWVVLLAS